MAAGDELLPEYFPVLSAEDRARAGTVSSALAAANVAFVRSVPGGFLTAVERAAADRATEIISARAALKGFLDRLAAPLPDLPVSTAGLLGRLYDRIRQRVFGPALGDVEQLASLRFAVPELTAGRIAAAFTSTDVTFAVLGPIVDENEPEHLRRKTINRLKGYQGVRFDSARTARLLALRDFLAGDPERDFRVRLWRAECHVGQARAHAAGDPLSVPEHYAVALQNYQRLLPPGTRPLTERQRMVAVRAATAQVGRGDALFRRSFRFTAAERSEIVQAYCAALGLLRRAGPGPEVDRLDRYAQQQLTKLGVGQNFLGYRDSHVPDLGPATLAALAKSRIDAARDATDRFDRFRTRADELVEQLAAMTEDRRKQELGVAIAAEATKNAADRAGAAATVVANLQAKSDDLLLGLGAGLSQSVFATVALGVGGGVAVEGVEGQASGPGVISSLVQYLGAREDLANQVEAAKTAQRIADRDETIAGLEQEVATGGLAFLRDAIEAKDRNDFGTDRFYAVANTYQDLSRRHLDRACELLYLYERAVAFRRLKPLTIVEAEAASGDVLLAPAQLEAAWQALNEEARFQGRGQNAFPLPAWSLRARYPLEFAGFLQTGEMDFVISVYELEKLLHGRYNVRVRRVGVEVDGLVPAAGFVGTLTHRGVTLVRDRDATLQPAATRLAPTEAELRAALGELEGGTSDRVVVQGLVPLVLIDAEDGSLSISSEQEVSLPDDDLPFDLLPIENYGLTGAWRLEVPDTDLRNVTDVRLMFIVSIPAASPALDDRVVELIDAYEAELGGDRELDSVLAVSVRQRFPDAFAALAGGPASVVLDEDDFPGTDSGSRVTAVLAQAVDADGAGLAGIGLEISADPGPSLVRTTGPGGFTEDLSAELPEIPEPDRPAPAGSWRLRLLDPGQFAGLGDLTLFVVHTLR
jgi:hypothetical protein